MLKITLDSGPKERFLQLLRARGPQLLGVLTGKLTALMFQLQAYIVTRKLSGQVLKRRTGILAGSVRAIPAQFQGTSIVGTVEAASGPAFYGKIHEMGGVSAYQIIATKARALAFMMDGKKVFAKSVMHPPAMMRPFLRPSLAENAEDIRAQLQAALDEEMSKP